jgi:hypothetical protein
MAKNYRFLTWRTHPLVVAHLNRTPEQKAADAAAFKKFQADAQAAIDKLWATAPCNNGMCPFDAAKPKV